MKRLILCLLVFVLLALPSMAGAASPYYCDPSITGLGGAGTHANPYKSVEDVNDQSFSTGDDVYFKVGTTANTTERLILWSGTSTDQTIIGAYEADGDFVMEGGETLPIIDGGGTVPANDQPYRGLIQWNASGASQGYVTIQDLHINDSGSKGIRLTGGTHGPSNVNLYRNEISNSYKGSLEFDRIKDFEVKYNTFHDDYGVGRTMGGGVVFTGGDLEGACINGVVSNNKIYNSGGTETLNFVKKAQYILIEKNVIYDHWVNVLVYFDAVKDCTVRYNLIYESATGRADHATILANGIVIQNESTRAYCFTGNHEVYGNLIVSTKKGIAVACQKIGCYQSGVKIYNNTLIDNEYNIHFSNYDANWDVDVKNNISYTIEAGTNHIYPAAGSPTGVTWSHNLYDEDPCGACNADDNAVLDIPDLIKTSGWQSLTAGAETGHNFYLEATSPAIDAGTHVSGYEVCLKDTGTDFTASPSTIVTASQTDAAYTPTDIGAFVYVSGDPPPASCGDWYSFATGVDAAINVGRYNGHEFAGVKWTQPSDQYVCEVDVYVHAIIGTLTASHDYYMRIFTVDGNNDADSVVGTSSKIDGDSLVASTWISANAGIFEFDPALFLSESSVYAFTVFPDTDGNQSDDPENDTSNYWNWGKDDENDTAANQEGTIEFNYLLGVMPYADNASDVEDDLYIKVRVGSLASSPTITTNIGIITDPLGTPSYNADQTVTWSTTDGLVYVGLPLSEQLTISDPNLSTLTLSPTYGAMVGQSIGQVLIDGTYYLVYRFKIGYTWNYTYQRWDDAVGHRGLNLQTAAVGTALALNGTTMQDGDSNNLDTTLPSTDIGVVTLANPRPADDPFTLGSGKDFADKAAFDAVGAVANDVLYIYAMVEDHTWTDSDITIKYLGALTGDLAVSGDNNTIYNSSRWTSGSRADTGSGNTWYLSLKGLSLNMGIGLKRTSDSP